MQKTKGATAMAPQMKKLCPDILAAQRHLALLGYQEEEPIYLRQFAGKGLSSRASSSTVTMATLPTSQDGSKGVYFVVNGGGQKDIDVSSARAFFIEFDDRPIEDQLAAVAASGLPEATCIVKTRKSVHCYWRFTDSIGVDQWKQLQEDANAWLGSDETIKNPSRVMRLAGYWHVKADADPVQCELVADGGASYSYDEIRAIVPHQVEETPPLLLGNTPEDTPVKPLPKKLQRLDGSRSLSDSLEEILTRLSPEAIYSWHGHQFQWSGTKGRGCCPWHESTTGTAFHIEPNGDAGQYLWHCPTCDIGGDAVAYRDRLAGGNGHPTGRRFAELVVELGREAGVEVEPPRLPKQSVSDAGLEVDDEDRSKNHWGDTPENHQGELGYWFAIKACKETRYIFKPKTNFDFTVVAELASNDGMAGMVLQVKRSLDQFAKTCTILSLERTKVSDFVTALTRAHGHDIVCNLKMDQLNSLIHTRLAEYREAGGKVYRLADRIGCQEDGYWVFPNCQFTPAGQPCTQETSGWVYNEMLVAGEDRIPAPTIAPPDDGALKRLVEAVVKFVGPDSMDAAIFVMGYVVAGLHYTQIQRRERRFPLINLTGDPGSLKTIVAEAALSIVGNHGNMISRSSESALYERLKKTGCITTCYDDPQRGKDLDELFKRLYNGEARVLRKIFQEPHSAIMATSNHGLGDDQPATKSRLISVPFFPTTASNPDAWDDLVKAKAGASGMLPKLISLGYPAEAVRAEAARLRPHLPAAHARVADSIGLVLWYAKAVARLAGYSEERLEQYAIATLCTTANDAETNKPSLIDFLEKLGALQAAGKIGGWNVRAVEDRNGRELIAIYMPSVWPEFDCTFSPAYSRTIIQAALTRAGASNGVQRFYRTRDETLAYQRACLAPPGEDGHLSEPEPVPRKCVLLPADIAPDLYLAIVPPRPQLLDENPVTLLPPVTSLLPISGNSQNPGGETVIDSSLSLVTFEKKERVLREREDGNNDRENKDPLLKSAFPEKTGNKVTSISGGAPKPSAAPVSPVTTTQVTSGNRPVTKPPGVHSSHGGVRVLPVTTTQVTAISSTDVVWEVEPC
jgi:hypothetical protein